MGEPMTEHRKAEQASGKNWLWDQGRETSRDGLEKRWGQEPFPFSSASGDSERGHIRLTACKDPKVPSTSLDLLRDPAYNPAEPFPEMLQYMSPNLLIHLAS